MKHHKENQLSYLELNIDGGADHNSVLSRTIISHVHEMMMCNVELIIHGRNSPGNSVIHPCERVMCVLTLVQTGMAFARVQCSEEVEKKIKASKTRNKFIIRHKNNKQHVDEFKTSISANIEEIEIACARGKYSNKNTVMNQPATDE